MPIRQKMLRGLFGYAAIIAVGVFATMVPVLLRAPFPHATSRFNPEPYGLLLIAMRELMFLMPPVVAIANGMAWLALRKGLPSARAWAIAASLSFVVLSIPFLAASITIAQYRLAGAIEFGGVFLIFSALNLLGVAGTAAFAKRDALVVPEPRLPLIMRKKPADSSLAPAA